MKRLITRKVLILLSVMMLSLCGITGCGSSEDSENKDATEQEVVVEENENLSATTVIAYSAGSDSDWSYGNQRKEFPDEENCYVRIASTLVTDKGKYVDAPVVVTYRFTGTDKCKVNISDGVVTTVDTGDTNVTEFTRTLYANKEKKAKEDVVIFQYLPAGSEGITLEVLYDDQVSDRYDARNAIYFKSNGTTTVQEVEEVNEVEESTVTEPDNSAEKKENGIN